MSNGVTGGFSKGGAGASGCEKTKHSFLRISNIFRDVEAEFPFGQMVTALTMCPVISVTGDTWRRARENTTTIDQSGHRVGRESPRACHHRVLGELGRKREGQRLHRLVVFGRNQGAGPHP